MAEITTLDIKQAISVIDPQITDIHIIMSNGYIRKLKHGGSSLDLTYVRKGKMYKIRLATKSYPEFKQAGKYYDHIQESLLSAERLTEWQ